MPKTWLPFPTLHRLTAGLRRLLSAGCRTGDGVTVLERKRNCYYSTFPSEVVTCRLADGTQHRLFCKYDSGRGHADHGHRGGVAYEGEVYRQVLLDLPQSLAEFRGTFTDPETGNTWLVLEYLDSLLRLDLAPEANAISAAAAWAGRFHALGRKRLEEAPVKFLTRYDAEYYRGWSRRTLRQAQPVLARHPWLRTLCKLYEDLVVDLAGQPQTIIHGEYTPHNVIWHHGKPFPVDWESAAVAVGEIDLATLLIGWDDSTVEACEKNYREARWPGQAAADFHRTLELARLYVMLRWLAVSPKWFRARGRRLPLYVRELRRIGERLKVI